MIIFDQGPNPFFLIWRCILPEAIVNPGPTDPGYALPLHTLVDPDQLANWSRGALFAILDMNLYQQPGSSNLIGSKSEIGMAS